MAIISEDKPVERTIKRMKSNQLEVANNGVCINSDIQDRSYLVQSTIETQQQQIENLQETVSGLQLENLQYQFSGLKEANPDTVTLYNDLEQRIVEQDRDISAAYEQQLLQRASELDTYGDQNRLLFPPRKLIDTNPVILDADIQLDMKAVKYLKDRNQHRLAQVMRGFELRYNMPVTDYDKFNFRDAPDAVIDALNYKSDLENLPRYRKFVDEEGKLQAIEVCESVIRQWKAFNTPSDGLNEISVTAAERQLELVSDMIKVLDNEIQDSSWDGSEFSD